MIHQEILEELDKNIVSTFQDTRGARFALAVKLYEMGRLTSGQAARLAGVSRVTFLLDCRRYGAASVEWDQAEIDAEFADMDT